ncbi:hypothetical protein Zmor_000804 [Zophobas morio]|uniref:Uncharacterized protein n=1 Tax=Zophobas morio TaxID=2755281 RepID=A0AA38MS43_9CUCU|nr:hypothetical protein Zmor_000804 [Zophobas morio]
MDTRTGHTAGMLDRDQRTAKIHTFDRHVVPVKEHEDPQTVLTRQNETVSQRVPGRTSPHSSCKTRKSNNFWKSLSRLKQALIVSAYLTLLTFPIAQSAPTIRKPMSSREKSDPKWLNPCGMGSLNGAAPEHRMPDSKLIEQIASIAQIAESKAKTFQIDFADKLFNMKVGQLHTYYADKDYAWLPMEEIPKKLNEQVPQDHLQSLEFKQTLLKVYVYLQKIAVGMEQVVWDEEDRNGEFKSSFAATEDFLHNVLCEIHTAIIENDLTVEETVTRDLMGEEYRNMDDTNKNVRNWIIYRDYLNMLEYIVQVFNHFKANSSK